MLPDAADSATPSCTPPAEVPAVNGRIVEPVHSFARAHSLHWHCLLKEMKWMAEILRQEGRTRRQLFRTAAIEAAKFRALPQNWRFLEQHEERLPLLRRAAGRTISTAVGAFWKQADLVAESMRTTRLSERALRRQIADMAILADEMKDTTYKIASRLPDPSDTTGYRVEPSVLMKRDLRLRPYQREGLDWLVALDEAGVNGMLADEMGLGKTVQTIALLAHIACREKNPSFGPHLIVVPTSVVLNWEMEFKRWAPGFKIVVSLGTEAQRKKARQGFNKPDSFHVMLTSYDLILRDKSALCRKEWEYLILDEAHNIKNFQSQRWQALMSFNARHRLILTGTPLQNSLTELWALIYYLHASDFPDAARFNNVFGGPLMKAIMTKRSDYYKDAVERLHVMLRPFLLRRLKKDVEKDMPKKIETCVKCHFSRRQKILYEEFLYRRENRSALLSSSSRGVGYQKLMNILMQLRKICNHPDLLEPRPVEAPFVMGTRTASYEGVILPPPACMLLSIPRRCFFGDFATLNPGRRVARPSDKDPQPRSSLPNGWESPAGSAADDSPAHRVKRRRLSEAAQAFLTAAAIDPPSPVRGEPEFPPRPQIRHFRSLEVEASSLHTLRLAEFAHIPISKGSLPTPPPTSFIKLWAQNISETQWSELIHPHAAVRHAAEMRRQRRIAALEMREAERAARMSLYAPVPRQHLLPPVVLPVRRLRVARHVALPPLVLGAGQRLQQMRRRGYRAIEGLCLPARALAAPAEAPWAPQLESLPMVKAAAAGGSILPEDDVAIEECERNVVLPDRDLLLADCGKFRELRRILASEKRKGNKCVIFTQMSRMLDVLEGMINHLGYRYVRLDGGTKPEDRQRLVETFNRHPKIFLFISSTRAGGVGINLTGANNVIFFDTDWNPAMDRQAMDRCHRIGQTKDVSIYRLLTADSIEMNVFSKQLDKRLLDSLVVDRGQFTVDQMGKGVVEGQQEKDEPKANAGWSAKDLLEIFETDTSGIAGSLVSQEVQFDREVCRNEEVDDREDAERARKEQKDDQAEFKEELKGEEQRAQWARFLEKKLHGTERWAVEVLAEEPEKANESESDVEEKWASEVGSDLSDRDI